MICRKWCGLFLALAGFVAVGSTLAALVDEYKSGLIWPKPPVVDPGAAPRDPAPIPSDATVLFDGKDLSAWEGGENWLIENGVATVAKTGITTKQKFGSCQLHLEFATPEKVEGTGQGRGNSGVYLMGQYEVQILDSYENETYYDGQCASIYKQQPPIVNACRKPGEWQTLDIIFDAPQFDAEGKLMTPGYVTVLHNGVLVQHHFALQGVTSYTEAPRYIPHEAKMPLHLQNHGNPMRFRNIWIRENIAMHQPTKPPAAEKPPEGEKPPEKPAAPGEEKKNPPSAR